MKKILVPGAGYGQEIVIKKAKSMGLFVIVVSPRGEYPGFKYADKIYYEDVRDKEKVLEIARRECIDGIVSDQNDIPVETIGYVAEHLALTGNDHAVSLVFTRKDLMRKKCEEIGVPAISYDVAKSVDEGIYVARAIGYPVMCKPVDNQSSKGVFRFDDEEQLKQKISKSLSCSFVGKVIIEKFVEGKEYVIEGLAVEGAFKNLLLLERTYFKQPAVFIPSMVTSPTSLAEGKAEELLRLNKIVCTSFGLKNGLSHSEFILNSHDDRFYLVETAARGGGVYTSSHLLSYACDFDATQLIIELCMGEKRDIETIKYATKAVRYISFYIEQGEIKSIDGVDKIKKMSGVLDFYHRDLSVGDRYQGLADKSSRLGPILLGCEGLDEIERTTEKIRDTLIVRTEDCENAVVWD